MLSLLYQGFNHHQVSCIVCNYYNVKIILQFLLTVVFFLYWICYRLKFDVRAQESEVLSIIRYRGTSKIAGKLSIIRYRGTSKIAGKL